MPLLAGTRLGPYEILGLIGAGGMGEVYKARDPRLNRLVAIKVLPAHLSADPERRQRLEREARAVAALQHPHICTLHDIGDQDGTHYLVLEHLEGETLADRLKRGALKLGEGLRIGIETADALDQAHRAGIVHRDLKPGNIMVTKSGVKLLDFGLAKLPPPPATVSADHSMAATETFPLTREGSLLGTLPYMSPEQLEGKEADARTDIFAFGAVVYEMATGRRAFEGRSQASLISAIMSAHPPPMSALQTLTPPMLEQVVKACLAKDPSERLQSAHDIKLQLEWIASGPETPTAPIQVSLRSRRYPFVAVGLTMLAALTLALVHFRETPPAPRIARFPVPPPEKASFASPAAVSPDGRRLAYGAIVDGGKSQLWVRPLDSLTAQPLAGTEGAAQPFWSPDNRFLGFFADGKLKRVEASGGPTLTLCDAPNGRGGTWSTEGVIVFAPNMDGPLHRVSSAGGVSGPVTEGQTSEADRWPWFLPDGRHFLYVAANASGNAALGGQIRVASIDSKGADSKVLVESQFNAIYAQGYLLFLRGNTLMAQSFDTKRLATTADAVPLAEQVQTLPIWMRGVFSASENGSLVYGTGAQAGGAQLAWFDRSGKPLGTLGEPGFFGTVHLSPDGKRVTVSMLDAATHNRDIWHYDASRGLRTRFTFDAAEDREHTWSADGSTIVFNSNRKGHFDLFQKSSNGAGAEELLYADNLDKYPSSLSPDGKFLLYWSQGDPKAKTRNSIWVLPLTGERKPHPLLRTDFGETWGQFSPDGRWIAYRSDESQRGEIYVAPFPGPGGKRQISTSGGDQPIWRRDGKEIFYIALDNRLMAAELNLKGDVPSVGLVRRLFGPLIWGGGRCYDASADGQRFLVRTEPQQATSEPLTLVQDWTAGLKR